MKFTILQQDLLPVVQAVARSVGVRANLPVLANVLIQTESGKLKFSATNLEVGVIKVINAQIEEEGEITVPAKTLLEVVASLVGAEITVETTGEQLRLSTIGGNASKSFKATLNGISAMEFPSIPLSSEQSLKISSKVLQRSLPQITFAAASDEGRPVLTGILTEIKDGSLQLVATDGFRLAHVKHPFEGDLKQDFKVLIPRRTFEEIVRLIAEDLGAEDEPIELSTSENQNQVVFKIGNTQLSSRLIEGQFPSWEKIVPTKYENRTIVDRQELIKAVKLASVFAKDASSVIKVETGAESGLKLSSETRELGEQQTQIEAQVEGGEIVIAFNSRYLIEALSAAPTTQVAIEFSGNLSPVLIKPIGEVGLEYVVMPIRLN